MSTAPASLPSAFYVARGDGVYDPTEITRGPWSPGHQHAGPPSALLCRAISGASALPDGQMARLTVDILRPVPIAPVEIRTQVLRPGRRVEQLQAELLHAGEPLMRATAWRVRIDELAGAPEPDAPPPLDDARPVEPWLEFGVAFPSAFEWRLASGTVDAPGPACVWARQAVALVDGEAAAPLERLVAMGDAASGVSAQLPWDRFYFPNLDYSLHLERPPEGEWMAMDAVTRVGPGGAAQCTAVLHDSRGRVGLSTQTVLIEAR